MESFEGVGDGAKRSFVWTCDVSVVVGTCDADGATLTLIGDEDRGVETVMDLGEFRAGPRRRFWRWRLRLETRIVKSFIFHNDNTSKYSTSISHLRYIDLFTFQEL